MIVKQMKLQGKQQQPTVETLHQRGFWIGRGKWKKATKRLLANACSELQRDITLALSSGSVTAYLGRKCGVSEFCAREQMNKYFAELLDELQQSFARQYVLCVTKIVEDQ